MISPELMIPLIRIKTGLALLLLNLQQTGEILEDSLMRSEVSKKDCISSANDCQTSTESTKRRASRSASLDSSRGDQSTLVN